MGDVKIFERLFPVGRISRIQCPGFDVSGGEQRIQAARNIIPVQGIAFDDEAGIIKGQRRKDGICKSDGFLSRKGVDEFVDKVEVASRKNFFVNRIVPGRKIFGGLNMANPGVNGKMGGLANLVQKLFLFVFVNGWPIADR